MTKSKSEEASNPQPETKANSQTDSKPAPKSGTASPNVSTSSGDRIFASPLARKIAEEKGYL